MSFGDCPHCGEETDIELSWDNLSREDLICNHCSTAVEIDHDEDMDGDVTMWLIYFGSNY